MSFFEYLYAKAVTLCFLSIGVLLFLSCMAFAGAARALTVLSALIFVILTVCWLTVSFFIERNRLRRLEHLVRQLPERYLLGEILPKPANAVEKRYYEIMKEISASAIGITEAARREKEDYCSYVESWIHEIKTPLAACSLILSNGGDAYKLKRELRKADNLTESILYYARLRDAQKDTQIQSVRVSDVIHEAVKSQMEILTASGISVSLQGDFTVCTDKKALCFILKQLFINSAKYCPGCRISILSKDSCIIFEDNGIGIPDYELNRVTERGFTGSNGRLHAGSTGMGLYIVSRLCRRMDIGLAVASQRNSFTRITLTFACGELHSENRKTRYRLCNEENGI